jgi:DNA-binding MarR family transcriptional regulator
MLSSVETSYISQQILEIIPLVMRTIAFELRQGEHLVVAPHFRVLWMLKHRAYTLSELAEHQAVTLPTMSNSITILEERGWVARFRSDNDRRKVLIELSPAGRDVLSQVQREAEQRVTEHLSSLSESEGLKLIEGLQVLRSVFAPDIGRCPTAADPTDK